MWWKPFLESDDSVHLLPFDKLDQLSQSAVGQLRNMQDQENALRAAVNDAALQICGLLATEDQNSLPQDFANLSPHDERSNELRTSIARISSELDSCEQEILAQQLIQSHIGATATTAQFPIPIRNICAKLAEIATSTDDKLERNDCLLSLDLLSGDTKLIASTIHQNAQDFHARSLEVKNQLDLLIKKTARSVKKVHALSKMLDDTFQKTDIIGPMLPKLKIQLTREILEFGDTRDRLVRIRHRVDTLRAKRDELENECSAVSAGMLDEKIESVYTPEEMELTVDLRQEKAKVDLQENEVLHRRTFLESEVQSTKDAMVDARRGMDELKEQGKVLHSATEAQRWKPDLLQKAHVEPPDFEIIMKCCAKGTYVDLERTCQEKQEYLRLLERKRNNVAEKANKLLENEKSIDEQIRRLQELLATTKP
jgi:hypothetical protein